MGYYQDAKDDAKEMACQYSTEIAELINEGHCSEYDFDCNNIDGLDCYHHESHVDKHYALLDAAELLDELAEFEETDSGLWEGCEPRQAIGVQAAFTYGSAVWHFYYEIIGELLGDLELEELLEAEEPDAGAIEERVSEFLREY
ncbi:MAG: hypothetical protein KDA84_07455 [Planctomycetaceae bacterium]|nr:hypothetical protein [Planctomycetaceae bacterium]